MGQVLEWNRRLVSERKEQSYRKVAGLQSRMVDNLRLCNFAILFSRCNTGKIFAG